MHAFKVSEVMDMLFNLISPYIHIFDFFFFKKPSPPDKYYRFVFSVLKPLGKILPKVANVSNTVF